MIMSPSFQTVDDAARAATAIIEDGSDLEDVWRHAVVQMLNDFTSRFGTAVHRARGRVGTCPRLGGTGASMLR